MPNCTPIASIVLLDLPARRRYHPAHQIGNRGSRRRRRLDLWCLHSGGGRRNSIRPVWNSIQACVRATLRGRAVKCGTRVALPQSTFVGPSRGARPLASERRASFLEAEPHCVSSARGYALRATRQRLRRPGQQMAVNHTSVSVARILVATACARTMLHSVIG